MCADFGEQTMGKLCSIPAQVVRCRENSPHLLVRFAGLRAAQHTTTRGKTGNLHSGDN